MRHPRTAMRPTTAGRARKAPGNTPYPRERPARRRRTHARSSDGWSGGQVPRLHTGEASALGRPRSRNETPSSHRRPLLRRTLVVAVLRDDRSAGRRLHVGAEQPDDDEGHSDRLECPDQIARARFGDASRRRIGIDRAEWTNPLLLHDRLSDCHHLYRRVRSGVAAPGGAGRSSAGTDVRRSGNAWNGHAPGRIDPGHLRRPSRLLLPGRHGRGPGQGPRGRWDVVCAHDVRHRSSSNRTPRDGTPDHGPTDDDESRRWRWRWASSLVAERWGWKRTLSVRCRRAPPPERWRFSGTTRLTGLDDRLLPDSDPAHVRH